MCDSGFNVSDRILCEQKKHLIIRPWRICTRDMIFDKNYVETSVGYAC